MFACEAAMPFAAGVTSRGLPGVLIKITSGSSHVLISGALKMMSTPLHAHGRWGKGVSSVVFDCVGGVCVLLRAYASQFFCEGNCNSCWGGGRDSTGELTLRRECGQCCLIMARC